MDDNIFDLLVNEYVILQDVNGQYIDRLCWTGETHRRLNYKDFFSHWFGTVKPMKGDIYQMMLADSLANN